MSEWICRNAEPADAADFSKWVSENPLIDPQDVKAGLGKNNPTVQWFVAEKGGVVVAFAPVYLAAVIAHLGFNPESRAADRKQALEVILKGGAETMFSFGVTEVLTLSKPEYGVAKWAMSQGFEQDPRSLFRLDLNKAMVEV